MKPPDSTETSNMAIEFANVGYDADDVRPELARWARQRLGTVSLDARSLERIMDLHVSVRAVLDGHIDHQMLHRLDAVAVLNRVSRAAPVSPVLVVGADGAVTAADVQRGRDLENVLAAISRGAIAVVTSFADRLRRCEGPGCRRYFVRDRAHRTWCSLGCGNRARVARHYARNTTAQSPIVSTLTERHRS